MELFAEKNQHENNAMDDDVVTQSMPADAKEDSSQIDHLHTSLRTYDVIKRAQDLVLSLLALILLLPVFLVIAVVIVVDDPAGGPIFTQMRCGKGNRLFRFYKFRTMVVEAEDMKETLQSENEMDGPVFKIKDDPRITRVGKFLRRTSLDELPQLVNIIKGEMSIVGPRPPVPKEVLDYTEEQMKRLSVIPGLTCYWQTRPDRYEMSFEEWVELDLQYIRERSYWLDWKLVFRTVKTVLLGNGV